MSKEIMTAVQAGVDYMIGEFRETLIGLGLRVALDESNSFAQCLEIIEENSHSPIEVPFTRECRECMMLLVIMSDITYTSRKLRGKIWTKLRSRDGMLEAIAPILEKILRTIEVRSAMPSAVLAPNPDMAPPADEVIDEIAKARVVTNLAEMMQLAEFLGTIKEAVSSMED